MTEYEKICDFQNLYKAHTRARLNKRSTREVIEFEMNLATELKLDFNEKTQIMPMASGVDYLGFHFYITETGKVIRRLRASAGKRYKRRFRSMKRQYASGGLKLEDIGPVVNSYNAHLSHGHTYSLRRAVMKEFVLRRRENTEELT